MLDQLNSIDTHCIQLFRKALGSPSPPASLLEINMMVREERKTEREREGEKIIYCMNKAVIEGEEKNGKMHAEHKCINFNCI